MKETNTTEISVKLSDKQEKSFREWLNHIKSLYGEYGLMTWKITPTGIGNEIIVYSHNAKVELDLTDVDNW
jgi:hypothetical protein